jgi:hypothetical protein
VTAIEVCYSPSDCRGNAVARLEDSFIMSARGFRFVLLAALLIGSASAAFSGVPEALLRVDRPTDTTRESLRGAGLSVVAELDNAVLVVGDPAVVEKTAADLGLAVQLIDPDPSRSRFALAGLLEGARIDDLAGCGEILWLEPDWVLLREPRFDLAACLGSTRFMMTPLGLEPMGAVQPPPTPFASFADGPVETLDVDPLVVDMLTAIDTGFAMSHWQGVVGSASTRYSMSAGCQTAAEDVYGLFQAYGLSPVYQTHTGGHAPNVIGTLPGLVTPDQVYIVIGHLDDMPSSGPAPGADDNASGTAMVTALAEVMSGYGFASTIKFLAVTGEEFGLYGSEHYAAAAASAGEDIRAVLNGDMIGWDGDGIPATEDLDVNYNTSSAWLGNLMVQVAADYPVGIPVNAFQCNSMAYSDHWPFWMEGWSAICGITDNQGFCGQDGSYPYYHTSSDTIANCGPGAPEFIAASMRLYLATAAHLADALCVAGSPPSGLSAAAAGDNRIDLSWTAAGPGVLHRIERAAGGCADPGAWEVIGETSGSAFADTTASGAVPYAYTVRAIDGSGRPVCGTTNCAEATTTGACTEPPRFDGATAVVDGAMDTCRLTVTWDPPQQVWCGGPVAYNVYRSTTPGFDPGPANQIASAVSSTSYADLDVVYDEDYTYVVRAVDLSNGAEDANTVEATGSPTGPPTIGDWIDDAGDAEPAKLTLTPTWQLIPTGGHDAPGSYAIEDYGDNLCVAATTPPLELGPAPQLQFWSKYDIEDGWDKGEVQISTNGGASWSRLEVGYPYYSTYTSDACDLPTGQYFSGTDLSYGLYSVSLAAWSGQEVEIRWVLSSDTSVNGTGWWVDDITITDVSVPGMCSSAPTPNVFSDGFESGDASAWSAAVP